MIAHHKQFSVTNFHPSLYVKILAENKTDKLSDK